MKRKLLLLFFTFLFLNGYSQKYDLDTIIYLNNESNTISISNNTDSVATFTLKINETFPLSIDDILDSIKRIEVAENLTDYKAAWKFVARATFYAKPLTENNWQHDPVLFVNSIGGGFCDDRSSVLAAIWEKQGHETRITILDGHVVPELFVENHWEMYDPTLYLFYEADGKVMSVEELENKSDVIRRGKARGRKFAKYYETTIDNKDITDWSLDTRIRHVTFTLPSHSKLILTEFNDKPIAIIELSNKSKGEIKTPLIPAFIDGRVVQSTNGEEKTIETGRKYLFNFENTNRRIQIKYVFNKARIFFRINPLLPVLSEKNTVSLESNLPLTVTTGEESLKYKEIKPLYFYPSSMIVWHNMLVKRTYKPLYKKK